jgi:hypothetical protein
VLPEVVHERLDVRPDGASPAPTVTDSRSRTTAAYETSSSRARHERASHSTSHAANASTPAIVAMWARRRRRSSTRPPLARRVNTQRGILRFTDELIARVNRAGASGKKLMRADSGFWNTKVFACLEQAGLDVLDLCQDGQPRPRDVVDVSRRDGVDDDRELPRHYGPARRSGIAVGRRPPGPAGGLVTADTTRPTSLLQADDRVDVP